MVIQPLVSIGGPEKRLPPGWAWTTIGEVTSAEVCQDGPRGPEPFTYIDVGGIDRATKQISEVKVLPVADAPSRARQRLAPRDVLVSTVRPNLNAVAMVPDSLGTAIGSTGFHVLRTRWIEPAYLYYLVQSRPFVDAMSQLALGVLYRAVRPRDVASYSFPLAPLAEQRRIVAEIEKQFSRLGAAVAALKRAQANLRRYRASVLKAACEGRLVPQDPNDEPMAATGTAALGGESYGRSVPADGARSGTGRDHLPFLPRGWTWMALADMLSEPLSNGRSFPSSPNGFPVLRLTSLKNGRLDLSERKLAACTKSQVEQCLVRDGDFFVSRGNGSIKLVGRGGLARDCREPIAYPDLLIRIRLDEALCHPEFLAIIWDSPIIRKQVEKAAHTTAGIYKVSQRQLSEFNIPLPPLAEQRRIVAEVERRLSVVDELEAAVEANLKRAERLRQAILKRAFEGRLAPQDPNDEPAAVLLERIRAERRRQEPVRRSRGKPKGSRGWYNRPVATIEARRGSSS